MPSKDFVCSADGGLYGENGVYSTARSTCNTLYSQDRYITGQSQPASLVYYVYRMFLKFDTSFLAGATIKQANLKLVVVEDNSAIDFDVVIKKADWSAYDPASDANKENIYDLILSSSADDNIWRNTSGLSINTQYTSGNLNTAWINKNGYTYYGLISSRDISSTPPNNTVGGGNENVRIASSTHATTSYRPILTVKYDRLPNTRIIIF
ncbi:MAG: hypothetical protein WC554_00330 [Clostridia bacterium]